MTQSGFKKATKEQARLRLAFIGPAGSGKTFSSLAVAAQLGSRIAVIDTERGSAAKYADKFDFDVLELRSHSPDRYVEAIKLAEDGGYDVLVIDSLSHAWSGKDGALELVDMATKLSKNGDNRAAWRRVSPMHNNLVDAMLGCSAHLITTMRSKTEYVVEKDERTGKSVMKKIGLAPIQRDGIEYEFDVCGDIDHEHDYVISKTRCSDIDGKVFHRPGEALGKVLKGWVTSGAPVAKAPVIAPAGSIEPAPLPDVDAALQAALAADFIRMIGEAETSEKVLDVFENVHKASLPQSYLPPINEAVSKHFVRRIGQAEAVEQLLDVLANAHKASLPGNYLPPIYDALSKEFVGRIGNAATKSELDELRAHIKNANLPGPFVATVRSTYAQRSKLLSGPEAAA